MNSEFGDPASMGLDPNHPVHRLAIDVLDNYRQKEAPRRRLNEVFAANDAFRTSCFNFLKDISGQSLNITNSPRIYDLHQFITQHWTGVTTIFDGDKPWATLGKMVTALDSWERQTLPSNQTWQTLARESFVDSEVQRFWALF